MSQYNYKQARTSGKIVIFGQYKSGTTALFYKIRNSLVGDVRALFEAHEYIPEAADCQRWVLAKTILGIQDENFAIRYDTFLSFEKQIYLIRDPRDWLISGILFSIQQQPSIYTSEKRLQRILNLLKQKEANPQSLPFHRIAEEVVVCLPHRSLDRFRDWMERHCRWLVEFENRLSNHYPLKYEDFIDRKIAGLENYLDMPLSGSADCASEHEHVVRTKTYGDWRDWFLAEDVEYFKPAFEFYLDHYRYRPEWRLNDPQRIRSEYGSQYVERTVAMRKRLSV